MPVMGAEGKDTDDGRRKSQESRTSVPEDSHVVNMVVEDDLSESETELTPKMIRRFLSHISESDDDEDDDAFFMHAQDARSHQSGGDVSVNTTRNSSINHSERSQSTSVDKYSLQEARFMEQMRILRKFIRDRNNLIAGQNSRDEDQNQMVPPDGGWGWVVVLAAALVFFFAGGLSRCFTLIYLQFLEVFHQSAAATSATAAIFGAVKMCTSPIVSMLCQRFSKRNVAVSGGILTGLAMVMTSYPISLEYVYVSYGILAAFGINMVLTPCFIILGEYFKKKRARAMSIAMLGGSLGGMALPPLVNYLFDCYGYSGAMLIYSGLMFNICLAGTLFRPVKLISRAEVERKKEEKRRKKAAKLKHKESEDSTFNMNGSALFDDDFGEHKPLNFDEESHHSFSHHSIESLNSLAKQSDTKSFISSNSVHKDPDSLNAHVQFKTPNDEDRHSTASQMEIEKPPLRKRRVSFQMSTVTQIIPGITFDGEEEESDNSSEDENTIHNRCKRKVKHFLWSFGFHLFKKPRFLFYSLLMMASILCLSISGTFLSGLVSDLNMDKTHTSIMLSASAILDVPSKFASGFIFDLKKIRPYRSLPLAGLGFITGAFALGIGFSQDYVQLFIVFMIYNFFASAYHTQHATVLADLVGAENLSMAMGCVDCVKELDSV